MQNMPKTWMLLVVIALSLVSCSDSTDDSPVVNAPFNQVLAETELFTDIKENPIISRPISISIYHSRV